MEAIDEFSIEQRGHSGVTLAIDTKKIDEVRELITKFRRDVTTCLDQSSQSSNEVYQLSIAFFPLTHSISTGDNHD